MQITKDDYSGREGFGDRLEIEGLENEFRHYGWIHYSEKAPRVEGRLAKRSKDIYNLVL